MREVTLGGSALVVPALGVGCMRLTDVRTAADIVLRAIDRGITLFDTADYYGQGASETTLGLSLSRGHRDRATLVTKTGIVHRTGAPPTVTGRPADIRAACEGSLRRLMTDRIDLYLLARVDRTVPIEESVGAMAELVTEGKVRHIGLCEAAPGTLRRAAAVHGLAALQSEYALWERHVENGILDACTELGIGFIACRPLGLGLLAGATVDPASLPHEDWRRRDPRFEPAHLAHNAGLALQLRRLATAHHMTAAQLSLAWLADKGVVALAGMRQDKHLTENAAAMSMRLPQELRAQLDSLFRPGSTGGARYAPLLLDLIDQHSS
ncbi:aldo/keto reductase [Streptomyces sp. NPDC059176]|uniref:aldo/keto reductase n=1 Tax=Streptomyces sp. NPDC059176 TaxID=3346758 RepID=UPI0036874514